MNDRPGRLPASFQLCNIRAHPKHQYLFVIRPASASPRSLQPSPAVRFNSLHPHTAYPPDMFYLQIRYLSAFHSRARPRMTCRFAHVLSFSLTIVQVTYISPVPNTIHLIASHARSCTPFQSHTGTVSAFNQPCSFRNGHSK